MHARHLVEVLGCRGGHHLPVADAVDLVPEPPGRLDGVPVQREVALDEDLVGLECLRWEVVADASEDHVEVAVPPEVVAAELLSEDLAERRRGRVGVDLDQGQNDCFQGFFFLAQILCALLVIPDLGIFQLAIDLI